MLSRELALHLHWKSKYYSNGSAWTSQGVAALGMGFPGKAACVQRGFGSLCPNPVELDASLAPVLHQFLGKSQRVVLAPLVSVGVLYLLPCYNSR